MTGVVLVNPRTKFTNSAGVPIALGWVTVYEAGTTTLANTWQDKDQTTLNTNPIHLDANGECLLWGDSAKTYKLLLQDATLATVSGWPVDNIPGAADVGAAAAAAQPYLDDAQAAQLAAEAAEDGAVLAAATTGSYPNSASSNVPRGLTQASVGAITAGSGGTNGTFPLAWSSGNFSINPTGTFTVAGGALTAVTITGPGLYIGASATVPTPSFAASAGLGGGAAVALTAQFLITSGQGYWVQSANGYQLERYKNVSGVATLDSTIGPIPTTLGVDLTQTSISVASSTGVTTRERETTTRFARTTRPVASRTASQRFGTGEDTIGKPTGGIGTFPATTTQLVAASWTNTSGLSAGILTKIKIPPGGPVNAGGKLQFFLLRPTGGVLPTAGAVTFSLVQRLGEIDLDVSADYPDYKVLEGLYAPCQANDIVAYRGVNHGIMQGGSGQYPNDYSVVGNFADTTMAALDAGWSTTVSAGFRYFIETTVISRALQSSEHGPYGRIRLDSNGYVPADVGRSADMPWKGRKVVVVGTSIEEGKIGSGGTTISSPTTNWVGQLFEMLQCNGINEGVSSSYITRKTVFESLSLSATIAQLAAANGSGAYAYLSYENKVVANAPDLLIMAHGFNDRDFTVGTINSTDTTTFYGANNVVLAAYLTAVPHGRILFVTPTHEYGTQFLTDPTILDTRIESFRQAILALADKWGAGVADVTRRTGVSLKAIQSFGALPDNTHPAQYIHDNQAKVVYRAVMGI